MNLVNTFPIRAFLVFSILFGGGRVSALIMSSDTSSRELALSVSGGAIKACTKHFSIGRKTPQLEPPSTTRKLSSASTEGTSSISDAPDTKARNRTFQFMRRSSTTSLKAQVAKSGLAVILTYVLTGNLVSISFLSAAWYGFSKQTGMSPLFPGQWKPFLTVVAGAVAANVFMKPLQMAVSVGLAPWTERALSWLRSQFNGSKRMTFAVVLTGIVASSLGLFAGGITLASFLSGVPIFAP